MLTQAQAKLLRFIATYASEHAGVPPTLAEMAAGVGVRGKGAVHRILEILEGRGFIRRVRNAARGIEVVRMPGEDAAPGGEVKVRAMMSIDLALVRMGSAVSDADKAVLRRHLARFYPHFCGSMQQERDRGTDAYRMRAAALMAIVNMFWETICVLTEPDLWEREKIRFLQQMVAAINEGPGR